MDKQKEQEFIHELLDRTHITLKHLEMSVGEHEIIDRFDDVKAKYNEAVENLADLYQLIGRRLN